MSPRRLLAPRLGIAAVLLGCSAIAAPLSAQTIDEFPVPTAGSKPQCIAPGSDGNLWFTETAASKIGKITAEGLISEYTVHSNSGGLSLDVRCLAPGPDGNVWFTTSGTPGGRIGKITTSGVITLYPHVFPGQLYAITAGPDGAMWFTETTPTFHNTIGRITTGGAFSEYPLPDVGTLIVASGIVAGPDGNIWFAQAGAQEIGSITPDGATITAYPTTGFFPAGITVGPDGALWFTEGGASRGLGQITTDGIVTQYDIPSLPANVVAGPDAALWLTEGNKIAMDQDRPESRDHGDPRPDAGLAARRHRGRARRQHLVHRADRQQDWTRQPGPVGLVRKRSRSRAARGGPRGPHVRLPAPLTTGGIP